MKFVKSPDGEQVSAVNDQGITVGYIRKNRMGTHGHWHGWEHFKRCEYQNECIWAGVWCRMVYPSWETGYGYFDNWTDAPAVFANIKEFKEYYGGV